MSVKVSVVCSLYRGLNYLPFFLQNIRQQTSFREAELIFVHNDPASEEIELITKFSKENPSQVQHIQVPLEPLGASWNRGWEAAKGEFVAIWNVDDQREPDSLLKQMESLQSDKESVASYGDYVEVSQVGSKNGQVRHTPAYRKDLFDRSFPQGGAFTVFRRDLKQNLGGFDEQFKVGPDMEFSFRICHAGLRMTRTDGILGYFTNEKTGLSTRDGELAAAIDRMAVQVRYGVYDKIDLDLMQETDKFRIDEIFVNLNWIPLKNYWPEIYQYRESRKGLWILGKIRQGFRNAMRRLGILTVLHKVQRLFTNRDI